MNAADQAYIEHMKDCDDFYCNRHTWDIAWTTAIETVREAIGSLKNFAEENRESTKCKHPGCCCVCNHEKKCPEDGPSLTNDFYD